MNEKVSNNIVRSVDDVKSEAKVHGDIPRSSGI